MKLIIELTPDQVSRLQKENKHDLPITSFVKTAFKFKSVQKVKTKQTKDTNYQDILYRVNRNKQA